MAFVGLINFSGCQPSSDRLEINGTVTLDGEPVNRGSIRFASVGEKTLATGAVIQNGKFHVPQKQGLPPGTFSVQIHSPDDSAPPVMVRNAANQPGLLTAQERIPPEYNVNSRNTIEVASGSDNHFSFDIRSRGPE